MNYIELLTQEEKVNLCGIMGGRDFKELFKHNEREFQKIRKGFRAKSLLRTTLIISKKPGNTGISRDIRTEFTTDLLLSD